MEDLWSGDRQRARKAVEPLAVRMRPRTLAEFAGQAHLLGTPGDPDPPLLRRMIRAKTLTSVILHGPPGTGKTTLAALIASECGWRFVRENAANVSVKRIREVIDESARRVEAGAGRTALFLDEIHRFSRSQQDVLLDDVERGLVTLIGATTENPMFAVNAALVSRSTVFRLEALSEADVAALLRRAAEDPERGVGGMQLLITDEAIAHWASVCEGDARRALNALEVAALSSEPGSTVDLRRAEQCVQQKMIAYDHTGDQHYDAISAFIKSVRGSDPDAAVYWLALMLEAGEDPRFIARRLAILASEDIGNADPRGVMMADAAWNLVERVGMPECRIILSQATTYLALAPKSNAAYLAIDEAMSDVRHGRVQPVPVHLRDANKVVSQGSPVEGKGYRYTHDSPTASSIGGVSDQSYMGVEKRYYRPGDIGAEKLLRERLDEVLRLRGRTRPTD
ncbi:MAG: replication-associated recombination protein A [Planctomycetota bacterium]|nr:replication-associated recombination protein A [Planctomycetota bacterium]